jgi:hypothetical protein
MCNKGNSGAAERFNVHNRLVEQRGTCGINGGGTGPRRGPITCVGTYIEM